MIMFSDKYFSRWQDTWWREEDNKQWTPENVKFNRYGRLFIASLSLVLAVGVMKQRHRDPRQVRPLYQWSDLSSLSAEDINRRTLKAAAAIREKQAESPIRHQH